MELVFLQSLRDLYVPVFYYIFNLLDGFEKTIKGKRFHKVVYDIKFVPLNGKFGVGSCNNH